MKNSRANYITDHKGQRMVEMYVWESFGWGYQKIDQENDDGFDGMIFVRDRSGTDMGCRIFCQIKTGASYLKKIDEEFIYIQPYSPKEKLNRKIEVYNKSVDPVILFFVNEEKKLKNGKTEVNKKFPFCWWVRLDDYQHDGSSYLKIPRKNIFGSHSKGDLVKIIKPYLKNWSNFPSLAMSNDEKKHFFSFNLKEDSKQYYDSIRTTEGIKCGNHDFNVLFTRIGWRHITKVSRGLERINNSLRLLKLAPKIIENYNTYLIPLKTKKCELPNCQDKRWGLRTNVELEKGQFLKVEVILRQWKNKSKGINKFWFYSIHIIK